MNADSIWKAFAPLRQEPCVGALQERAAPGEQCRPSVLGRPAVRVAGGLQILADLLGAVIRPRRPDHRTIPYALVAEVGLLDVERAGGPACRDTSGRGWHRPSWRPCATSSKTARRHSRSRPARQRPMLPSAAPAAPSARLAPARRHRGRGRPRRTKPARCRWRGRYGYRPPGGNDRLGRGLLRLLLLRQGRDTHRRTRCC